MDRDPSKQKSIKDGMIEVGEDMTKQRLEELSQTEADTMAENWTSQIWEEIGVSWDASPEVHKEKMPEFQAKAREFIDKQARELDVQGRALERIRRQLNVTRATHYRNEQQDIERAAKVRNELKGGR
ncbi:MAG TPA: hypothetical protein VJJ24_02915 [Candidatus Paceibacterota bacterium]